MADPKTSEAVEKAWRCFHCDEVFTDEKKARDHFGQWQGPGEISATPMCQVPASEFREMEAELMKYHEEDTDLHRQIRSLEVDHAAELRRVEDAGYAKGLRDYTALEAVAEHEKARADANEAAARDLAKLRALVPSILSYPQPENGPWADHFWPKSGITPEQFRRFRELLGMAVKR